MRAVMERRRHPVALATLVAAWPVAGQSPKSGGILSLRLREDIPYGFSIHESPTISTMWPAMPCFNNLVLFDPAKPTHSADAIVGELADDRVRAVRGLRGIEEDEVVEARHRGPHRRDRRALVDREAVRDVLAQAEAQDPAGLGTLSGDGPGGDERREGDGMPAAFHHRSHVSRSRGPRPVRDRRHVRCKIRRLEVERW